MAGTFTTIDIGRKAQNMTSGQYGENLYDMVKLNLDKSNYVTSPYITVDDFVWAATSLGYGQYRIVCTSETAEAGWLWYLDGVEQAAATDAALAEAFGLVIHYPNVTPSVGKKLGDEIVITKAQTYDSYKVEATYSRKGNTLEADCPLIRNVIPTSPYVGVDAEQWAKSAATSTYPHGDGTYTFVYESGGWFIRVDDIFKGQVTDTGLWNLYGITIYYPDDTSAKSIDDTITVIRASDAITTQPRYEYIYTQNSGATIAPAQALCNSIFASIQGLGYQPLHADNAIINPAAEIGDIITVCGITSGLYYQEITFNSLMASNVGAPLSNEADPEMDYETQQERQYARKFADIAAEFNIQANQISAKVSRTSPAGQTSFSWELMDDHFSVLCNGNRMLYIDSQGSQFAGTVRASQIVVDRMMIGGQEVDAGYIGGSLSNYNQIAGGSIGGGDYGNLGFGDYGVSLGNVVGGIVTSLGYADFSNGVFNGDFGATTVMTYGIMDAGTGRGFTPRTIQYKDWNNRNATITIWGNTD